MDWLYPSLVVVALSGVIWAALVAWERWRAGGSGRYVSDASLRDYARDEMRQGWHQPLNWPKQKKGAQAFWDRKPTRLRDASRKSA